MSDLIPLSVLLAIIQNQTNNTVGELKTEIEALMVNAKSYGIKGDGETDDSILLNDLVSKLNTGELQNSQLKGIYLMRYMTDRCEIN